MPILQRPRNNSNLRNRRSGQALVEFAFVSIVFVMLSSLALAFGIMMMQGMVTANASASAGRILHHHRRLSPEAFSAMRAIEGDPDAYNIANPTATEIMNLITADFAGSTNSDEREFASAGRFGPPLYDERALVLTREQYNQPAALPELNRLLLPNYVYDADRDRFRYPGAVVQRDSDNALTVLVPLTEGIVDSCFNTGDCSEYDPDALTYWLRPLRICKLGNSCDIATNSMPAELTADGSFRVDITLPAQAGALVAFQPVRDVDGNVVLDDSGNEVRTRVVADDSTLTNLSILPVGYSLAPVTSNPVFASLSSRGDFGLGELTVLDMSKEPFEPIQVRPYRRVIEHSSTFRLGQRFEAMYELDTSSPTSPVIEADVAQPNSFMLARRRFDDAELFSNIDDNPSVMVATIPITGKWRINASASLVAPAMPSRDWNLTLLLFRDGVTSGEPVIASKMIPSSVTNGSVQVSGSAIIDAEAAQTIEIRVFHDCENSLGPQSLSLTNDSANNWISVEAVFLKDQPRMPVLDPAP